MPDNNRTLGNAIAGGVITVSLMQTLQEKGLLSVDECRGVSVKPSARSNPAPARRKALLPFSLVPCSGISTPRTADI